MAPPCVCEDFPLLLCMNWKEKCSTEGFIISIISIVIINMIATIKTKNPCLQYFIFISHNHAHQVYSSRTQFRDVEKDGSLGHRPVLPP